MSDGTAAPRDEVEVILDAIERASDYLHNSRAWASEGVIEEIIVPAVRQALAAAKRRGMERAADVLARQKADAGCCGREARWEDIYFTEHARLTAAMRRA